MCSSAQFYVQMSLPLFPIIHSRLTEYKDKPGTNVHLELSYRLVHDWTVYHLAASRGGYILLHWHLSNMQSFGNHIRAVTDNHGFFTYFGKFVTINGICSYKHN